MTSAEGDRQGSIRVLNRALLVLDVLSDSHRSMTISEIARATQLSKSTAFNLLRALVEQGLVSKSEQPPTYRIGARSVVWATAYLRDFDERQVIQQHLERLRDVVGEVVSLHVVNGDLRICIAQAESMEPVRRVVQLGSRRPLYSGAAGQVLMTQLDEDELQRYLSRVELKPLTQQTITDADALVRKVRRTAKAGYAIANQTTEAGVSAIAVPVRSSDGAVIAALAVSGPAQRWTARRMLRHLPTISGASEELTRSLGGAATLATLPLAG